jgi:hypothetical protein
MAVGNNYPFIGLDSRIGIGEETTYGVMKTSTVIMEFLSESMKQNREENKLEIIRGQRDYIKRIIGVETVEGSLEAYLNVAEDALCYIMKQALGGTATRATVVLGSYDHTFNLGTMEGNKGTSTATDVKGLSIAVERGDSDKVFNYVGCRVNNLTIKGELGQPCVISADFIGKTMSSSATLPTLSYSNVLPINFTGVQVNTGDSIGNVAIEYFQSFEFSLNNNIDGEQRYFGSRTVSHAPPIRREMTLSLTQRYDTTTAYDRFLNNTMTAIQIVLDSGVTITAGGTTYAMYIDLPECYYNSNQPEVGDTGPLNVEFECAALYNTEQTYAARIRVRNATDNYF